MLLDTSGNFFALPMTLFQYSLSSRMLLDVAPSSSAPSRLFEFQYSLSSRMLLDVAAPAHAAVCGAVSVLAIESNAPRLEHSTSCGPPRQEFQYSLSSRMLLDPGSRPDASARRVFQYSLSSRMLLDGQRVSFTMSPLQFSTRYRVECS